MGHRGLKIFYLNIEIFDKIKNEYHSKILEDNMSEEYNEFLYKILKKLKALELDLIKLNFRKLLNSNQDIIINFDASKYFNKEKIDIKEEYGGNKVNNQKVKYEKIFKKNLFLVKKNFPYATKARK
jgi:hypothetical protein